MPMEGCASMYCHQVSSVVELALSVSTSSQPATLPAMMLHYYSPAWVVIGVLGLGASLVSTFANNVTGFTSAWVQGIYQQWVRPNAGEAHWVWTGRITNAAAVLLSIGAAYAALSHHSLMEYIQMILSTFNPPLFALGALAALAPNRVARAGMAGFTTGLAFAAGHQVLVYAGLLHYGSQMSADFYSAILGFTTAVAATLLIGCLRGRGAQGLASSHLPARLPVRFTAPTIVLAIAVVSVCVVFNVLFW